jgi:hypothetical protein
MKMSLRAAIPGSGTEDVLKRFDTWEVASEGIKLHFSITSTRKQLLSEGGNPEGASAG